MSTILDILDLQIEEQKEYINYLDDLIYVERRKLKFLKKLHISPRKFEKKTRKTKRAIREWDSMTFKQKLDSPLPYDRETETSDLYDDCKPKTVTTAELDRELDEYMQHHICDC